MINARHPIGYVVEIDGANLLVNLLEDARGHVAGHRDGMSTVEQPGDMVAVEGGAETIILRIQSVAFAEPKEVHVGRVSANSRRPEAEPLRQLRGRVIGYLNRTGGDLRFAPQDWHLPVLGATVFPLSDNELVATVGDQGPPGEQITFGRDSRNPNVRVTGNVNDVLARHLAVLGATGQGKTHFVAAILQKLVGAPRSRVVVFDVNGEYARAFASLGDSVRQTVLGEPTPEQAASGAVGLKIPYYALGRHGLARLLLPSEKTQMPALRFAIEHLKYIEADANGAKATNQPDNVLFDDCRSGNADNAFQQLENIRRGNVPVAASWPHMRGLSCLAAESYSLKMGRYGNQQVPVRDAFSYGHVHSLINRIRALIDDERFRLVVDVDGGPGQGGQLNMETESRNLVKQVFGQREFQENDWRVHIVDLSRLTQDLMPFVLGSFLELFAAELFRRGPGNTHPTMLVLEEAHHYLRQLPGDSETGQHALAYERLAKEGRKFGISIMISTQRPSEVSATVLAQCGTWAVFRLTNETDQRSVGAAAESAGINVTRQLSGLGRGEAFVFGAAMPIPTRIKVIRPNPEPRSTDAPFVAGWQYARGVE